MKIKDYLKKMGLVIDSLEDLDKDYNIDEGTEDDKESNKKDNSNGKETEDKKEHDKKNNNNEAESKKLGDAKQNTDNVNNSDFNKEEKVMQLTFDKNTGLFDIDNIEDENIKKVLAEANEFNINTKNKYSIDKEIDSQLSNLKIRSGISYDAVRSLLDTSKIQVVDNKVVGVEEAVNNLKESQSGLFVIRQSKENNPILEGFNPANEETGKTSAYEDALVSVINSLTPTN